MAAIYEKTEKAEGENRLAAGAEYHLYSDDESGFNVCSKKLDPKSELA